MPLPTGTNGTISSGYFKEQPGNSRFLILDNAIEGYEYWDTNKTVHRSREAFKETPNIAPGYNGQEGKQSYFWAVPVWNFQTNAIEVYQIGKKTIRDQMSTYQSNEMWGDPTGVYSMTVTKTGEGKETKYTVTANPDKNDPSFTAIMDQYKANPKDLDKLFFGGPDIAPPAPEATPAPAAEATPEAVPATPAPTEAPVETPVETPVEAAPEATPAQ